MSWPTDGKPRYVTASIKGGVIGATRDRDAQGTYDSSPVYYVFDQDVYGRSDSASRRAGGGRVRSAALILLATLKDADERRHFTLLEIDEIHRTVCRIASREYAKQDKYQRNLASGRAAAGIVGSKVETPT